MPNDRFGSHKTQDPLTTMPRICDARAMSNGRGPAAKGVANKIYIFILQAFIGYGGFKVMELVRAVNQLMFTVVFKLPSQHTVMEF